jgi:hypothetical protein
MWSMRREVHSNRSPKLSHLIALLSAVAATAQAGTILVGTLGGSDGNCIPFSCPAVFAVGTYQQVYASSAFSGAVWINSLTFFNTVVDIAGEGNSVAPGTYAISLSTTSVAVGALSPIFANNIGPDNQVIFSGSLGGPLSGTSFSVGGTPFFYNPALGNLLLNVSITGATNTNPLTFFDTNYSSVFFSRMYPGDGDSSNTGLVTRFDVTAIPEPQTWILAAMGLLAVCLRLRKVTE